MSTDYSPAFQVDTDHVGSVRATINNVDPSGGLSVLISTSGAHGFLLGEEVTITGLADPFDIINGSYPIIDVPSSSTFRIRLAVAQEIIDAAVAETGPIPGVAFSPSLSYVRYVPHDSLIDAISEHATLYAEPWDFNTIRVVWGTDDDLDERAAKDVANGYTPLIVITRSGFGYPSTPIDGIQVLSADYETMVANNDRQRTVEYIETAAVDPDNAWNRPPTLTQSLYDRNLPEAHWFYYTLFFYLGVYDSLTGAFDHQEWVKASSMDATTVGNHEHARRLYELIPEYYQARDQEFTPGTGRGGVVERLLQTIGFDMDYTKTLADMLEHVYDIDTNHDDLLHSLGVFNFGIPVEEGLGDIRYRSLLARVSRLYEERGSASGLQQMTNAATKYRCKILEGSNILSLTDDAEFASGTGSWGNPSTLYSESLLPLPWAGSIFTSFNAVTLESVSLPTTPEGDSTPLVPRRNAMLVGSRILGVDFDSEDYRFNAAVPFNGKAPVSVSSAVPFNSATTRFDYTVDFDGIGRITGGVLVACGLGRGFRPGRRHEPVNTDFFPRLHGVRCTPGVSYTFSGYSMMQSAPDGPVGRAAVGIMWFNDVQDGVFVIDRDYIDKNEDPPEDEIGPPDFHRYTVTAPAPVATRGEPYVFAVPYFAFTASTARYISACMFNAEVGSAESFTLPEESFLRLGVVGENLNSGFVLGEPT